jgi:hypothetical protein
MVKADIAARRRNERLLEFPKIVLVTGLSGITGVGLGYSRNRSKSNDPD